jgi:hypothetical protein
VKKPTRNSSTRSKDPDPGQIFCQQDLYPGNRAEGKGFFLPPAISRVVGSYRDEQIQGIFFHHPRAIFLSIRWKGERMIDYLVGGSKQKPPSGHYGDDLHFTGYDERHAHYNPQLELAQKLLHRKAIIGIISNTLTILMICAVGIWLIVTLLPYLG